MADTNRKTTITKDRFTFLLPVEVVERARDAVYWTPGLSMAQLVSDAITAQVNKIETERAEKFPKRTGKLVTGRPVKDPE